MPLEKGKSKAARSRNIATEIRAGKPRDQAIAIAYSVARRSGKAGGGPVKATAAPKVKLEYPPPFANLDVNPGYRGLGPYSQIGPPGTPEMYTTIRPLIGGAPATTPNKVRTIPHAGRWTGDQTASQIPLYMMVQPAAYQKHPLYGPHGHKGFGYLVAPPTKKVRTIPYQVLQGDRMVPKSEGKYLGDKPLIDIYRFLQTGDINESLSKVEMRRGEQRTQDGGEVEPSNYDLSENLVLRSDPNQTMPSNYDLGDSLALRSDPNQTRPPRNENLPWWQDPNSGLSPAQHMQYGGTESDIDPVTMPRDYRSDIGPAAQAAYDLAHRSAMAAIQSMAEPGQQIGDWISQQRGPNPPEIGALAEPAAAIMLSRFGPGFDAPEEVARPIAATLIGALPRQIASTVEEQLPGQLGNIGQRLGRVGINTAMSKGLGSTIERALKQAAKTAGKQALHTVKKQAGGGIHISPTPPQLALTGAPGTPARRTFAGPLHTSGPGRTDNIRLNVRAGSYVMPARAVSILGEGNTLNGTAFLKAMFSSDLPGGGGRGKGTKHSSGHKMPAHAAGGRQEEEVPIIAAGGEYVIDPEDIERKFGNLERGHSILDRVVLKLYERERNELKNPPKPQT